MRKYYLLLSILLLFDFNISLAQISVPGLFHDRVDKLSDTTTLSLYSSINESTIDQFSFLNPILKSSFNSEYPRGYNDGAVWKGKGITIESHAGFQGRLGKISYTFLPVGFFSQNESFSRGESAPNFKYQFSNRIDWVQQYGSGSFFKIHPGQSEIKFKTGKFLASVSTQNYSLGPSIYNPIILSRQSGGFPHLRLGLEPVNVLIKNKNLGKFETNLIIGLLKESDYFDDIEINNDRYINILTLAYSPSFLPELKIGFNKSLYKQTRYFEPTDLFSTLFIIDDGVVEGDTLSPNDTFDQMASFTMDWNIKDAGFRVYMEFAKNDFTTSSRFRFTASEPEHTRAYTVGVEKELSIKNGKLVRLGYEHTNLSRNQAFLWRATPSYYAHGVNRNGYTNDGQILGAGIGPGGNSDHFSVELISSTQKLGLLLQRIEHNRDYFVANIADFTRHDIEYSVNGFFKKECKSFILLAETTLSHNYNKYFLSDRANFSFGLGVQFKINQLKTSNNTEL